MNDASFRDRRMKTDGSFHFAQRRAEKSNICRNRRSRPSSAHQFNAGLAPNEIRTPEVITQLRRGRRWRRVQFLGWPLGRRFKLQLRFILLVSEVEQRQLVVSSLACLSLNNNLVASAEKRDCWTRQKHFSRIQATRPEN